MNSYPHTKIVKNKNLNNRLQKYSLNLLVSILSISFSLIIAEGTLRVIFDSVDYLKPHIIQDDILGARVKPNSAGHDSWGYRNKFVPLTADIITIGDSQTYGISAPGKNSWPSVLSRITGESVYNISLGAYNPTHYFYLLEDKAVNLAPSIIIAGFYYGNDLIGAYKSVYSKDHWKYLRSDLFSEDAQDILLNTDEVIQTEKFKYVGNLRNWLSHHSILYRMFTYSFGDRFRFFELQYNLQGNEMVVLEEEDHKIRTGFTPLRRFTATNLEDNRVQDGLRISLELFSKMNEICKKMEITFVVALIPTKESVYSKYIENNNVLKNLRVINELIRNEERINSVVKNSFKENDILYIDLLDPLRKALPQRALYPSNHDGHPNKNGYEIIANAVAQFLGDLPNLR